MIVTLLQLAGLFALLSMLAIGGGAGVLPDMQRAAVAHGWVTPHEFLQMFAISRAAPGPGSQIVVLIGQKAAGLPGAASGRQRRQGRKPCAIAASALGKKRTLARLGVMAGQIGRQKMPVVRTAV